MCWFLASFVVTRLVWLFIVVLRALDVVQCVVCWVVVRWLLLVVVFLVSVILCCSMLFVVGCLVFFFGVVLFNNLVVA